MKNKSWLLQSNVIIISLLLILGACDKTPLPFSIRDFGISEDPIIGKVIPMHLEIISINDEPDATINISLPPGIQLVSGSTEWHGSLVANEAYTHTLSICVSYTGDWSIRATANPLSEEGRNTGGDSAYLFIRSGFDSGEIISPQKYNAPKSEPTPFPKLLTPVCPEQKE